jgi:SNF2 family DNA or RNA helicase
LIVAPKALLRQWKREIERRTSSRRSKRFSVHIHHGNDKLNSVKEFAQYDVVLTTYGTVLSAYRIFPCHPPI